MIKMKKFLNKPEDIMEETLKGYALSHKHFLQLKPGTHTMTRTVPKEQGKVKLVIGNGGGHDPGTPAQIGYGLYDMVSLGDVFACQSGRKLLEAIKELDDGSPILLTIANHAGDVMNGNLACRKAKAAGINIESVIHYDDVTSAPKGSEEERRGVGGIFFPTKAAGAAAEEGASLEECVRIFNETRDVTRSVSISLGGGTHPQTGLPLLELPDHIANIGAGSHGEGGALNIDFTNSYEMIRQCIDLLLEDMPCEQGEEVLLLISGMGGTTMLEMDIIYHDACKYLESVGVSVYDGTAADMVTTQEACGVTISICKATEEIKRLWDAPCATPTYTNITGV